MREMKDSGIEWIGEIPVGWKIVKIKNVADINMGQSPNGDDILDEGNLLFMQGNADFGLKYPTPRLYCDKCPKKSRIGDILMSVRAPVGEMNISDKVYGIGRGLCSIKPKSIERQYLWYYMLKSKSDFNYYSNGSTFDSITLSVIFNFPIPIPSLSTQQKISAYLDTKCTKIDSIIEKQEKVIEKLKDYKLSRINEIVTNVDGIECNLGRISSMKNGLNFNITLEGNKVKFLGVGDFKDYFVLNEKEMFSEIIITEEIPQEYLLENGDIVFVRSNGSKELVGRAVMVENIDFALTYSGFCIRFRNTRADLIDDKYLLYFFRSPYFRKQLERYSQGSNINNINQVLLSKISIIIPSPNYQITALETLDKLSSSIDSIITKKQVLIEKLTEYKKSLIYEVVTGKREV